jgi:hypothetical protein
MKPQNVDLVLLLDASSSMKPCFTQLTAHLSDLLLPLMQGNFKVSFALLAYAATEEDGRQFYLHRFLKTETALPYGPNCKRDDYFTDNPDEVIAALREIKPEGNEDTLMALDTAADLPFGPVESTRRVIALFTDETLENGLSGSGPTDEIPEIIQKLMVRRIQLFVSAPMSPALEILGSLDHAQIEAVDGGDGLKSVDFKKLLVQMAKSISISSLQAGAETTWRKAIFGQDRFLSAELKAWTGA